MFYKNELYPKILIFIWRETIFSKLSQKRALLQNIDIYMEKTIFSKLSQKRALLQNIAIYLDKKRFFKNDPKNTPFSLICIELSFILILMKRQN